MLSRFQCIILRDTLKADLDNKHMVIFQNYGLDLDFVQRSYEKFKTNPPMVRTAPRVAGSIIWCRQLLRRIEEPMNTFKDNKSIMSTKESKKIIRTYNRVATALVEFETLWHRAWCGSIEAAKAGLAATLLIRQPESTRLFANFDHEIVELIREAKCLLRLGIRVPEEAQIVSMQHEKFKQYYGQLLYSLKEYDRVMERISPVVRNLLQFHLEDLDQHITPGLTTITWTSLNIPTYLDAVAHSLSKLDDLVTKMNDMIENRIESNLKIISRTVLVDLDPSKFPFNVVEFVSIQEQFVKENMAGLDDKNLAVELAVQDLLQLVNSTLLDKESAPGGTGKAIAANPLAVSQLQEHYNRLMYHAILSCMRTSFNAIKKRVSVGRGPVGFTENLDYTPFFQANIELNLTGSGGSVVMSPSLEDIQDSLNRTAVSIIRSTRKMIQWGADRSLPTPESFFEELASEKQLVKVILLLSGALHGAAQGVRTYLDSFGNYSFLWDDNIQTVYAQFLKKNPSLEDFDDELEKYERIESEIRRKIEDSHLIGVLSLQTTGIKSTLIDLTTMWKGQYTQSLMQIAREDLNTIAEYMSSTTRKFGIQVESLEDVRKLMGMLKEVSDKESTIEWEFGPLEQKYEVLQHYGVKSLTQEELTQVNELRTNWEKLKALTFGVAESLGSMQNEYKLNLMGDVADFKQAVTAYTQDYKANGPGVSSIQPKEAISRLNRYERDFADLDRKYTMFNADLKDKKKVTAIKAQVGQEVETVQFGTCVVADGNIEDWMSRIEAEMKRSLKDIVRFAAVDCQSQDISTFISHYCAQVCLLGLQMQWTQDVQDAISRAKAEKQAMVSAQRKITDLMKELCVMTTDDTLTKRDRTNIETLITIQVHQKDVFDDIVKKKVRDPGDFLWQQQARFYWQLDENNCFMCVCEQRFEYCYEFLGCEDRLVITPLTDRCYITLTQALGMCKGGAPAGPAGTGKTETTKDLARAMGKYCVVTNCGPEMDFRATGKIFKGLAMCGAWGCFDEFNRIDLEVLSVCAQQIACNCEDFYRDDVC